MPKEGSMVINFKRLRGANLRKSRSFFSWVDAALLGVITFGFFQMAKLYLLQRIGCMDFTYNAVSFASLILLVLSATLQKKLHAFS